MKGYLKSIQNVCGISRTDAEREIRADCRARELRREKLEDLQREA